MEVQRLRILRELADRGSVTAVAAAMSFTPSAISQQLKALAEEVGLPLTEPAGRGLRLTGAGHALVAEAEAVLAALARADAAVERLRTTPRGHVRIALFPSGARMMLAGLLARLDTVPEVGPQCRDVDMTPADVPALAADFDIVISHRDEVAPPHPSERWEVVPLLREPLDVVLPRATRSPVVGTCAWRSWRTRRGSAWRSAGPSTTCCARSSCAPAPRRGWCSGSTTSR